jgi:RNA polymerase sigma-54 factor
MLSQQPVLRQEQRLKMTPQLYQAIRIMAMPVQELQATIQEELERNPALEVMEDNSTTSLETEPDGGADESVFAESSDPGYLSGRTGADADAKRQFIEGALTRPETLQDHLLWQLRLQPLAEPEFELGEMLIRNLDDNGFMLEEPDTLAPEVPPERLRKVSEMIQAFDPPGCCTRDYTDSLLAQIRLHPQALPGSAELVRDHIDLAERGKTAEIARRMAIPEQEVREILAFVRELDPIPGRNFSAEQVRYVSPDVIVKQIDGELALALNDQHVPVLGVSPFFEQLSQGNRDSRGNGDRELKKFVNHNLQDARWFMRSIDERNRSLLKVTRAVVEAQREFFRRGAKYLVPLTLKDVAAEVGVHEATVSRLANGKHVQTEFGIFELRYFFTNSISGAGSKGSRFSKTAVKEMLREIIESTTADGADGANGKPPSDSRLSEILAEKGVRIARRTVAKYRKELDIDSSYRRI